MADELIALDSSNQSAFIEAVKNIKKTIKSKKAEESDDGKYKRGIILVEHIPYGFFEEGLRGFFSQFGSVTRVRLARSKKTGRSKGYAFVEFEFEEVAKIAAESMNNYLMFERLVKCKLLPSDTNGKKLFLGRHYREDNYPKLNKRNELKRVQSEPLAEEDALKFRTTRLSKIEGHNKRLADLGIEYEFSLAKRVKSKPAPAATESPKQRTPAVKPQASNKKSPVNLKSKFSPKLLRSRARQSEGIVKPTVQSSAQKPKQRKSESKKLAELGIENEVISATGGVKSKPASTESPKQKTPEAKPKASNEKNPGNSKPKFSPKLRTESPKQTTPAAKPKASNEKSPGNSKPKFSPKLLRTESPKQKTPAAKPKASNEKSPGNSKPKFSPKLLRSRVRQSEGFNKPTVQPNAQKAKLRKSIK